jgi:1-acyl-sn-glycerol-3-phosphate acyltransferase/nucleoside-diphosphate-sugar epimerase
MSEVCILGGADGLTELLARRLGGAADPTDARPPATIAPADLDEELDRTIETLERGGALFPEASHCLVIASSLVVDRWGAPLCDRAARLFRACAARRPRRAVLIASALVHEPNHHHPGMVDESFPCSSRTANALSRRWRRLEAEASTAFAGVCPLIILRAAATPAPGSRDPLSRRLRSRLPLPIPGFDPSVQLLDPDDLAEAVALVVERPPAGASAVTVLHVAPAGAAPLRAGLKLACRPRLAMPLTLRRLLLALRLHPRARDRAGRRLARAELDLLRFPATVSGGALERLGFRPRFTTAETAVRRLRPRGARPLTGQIPSYDDWGMSPSFIAAAGRTVFRFLRKVWFRLEVDGIERLPRSGPAVLVGPHRGFVPLDAMLLLDILVRERELYPRFLVHPGLLRWPLISIVIVRLGGVIACRENAERVLARGGVIGVFPEGVQGAFRLYRDAYRVGRFLGHDFVAWARRHRAPLLPFVTVGSAEAFPILARIESRWWRRHTEWPFLPVTPTTPFLPVPLPAKWHTRFLAPIVVEEAAEAGAEQGARTTDRDRQRGEELRALLQRELSALRARRRSIFYGDLFAAVSDSPASGDPGAGDSGPGEPDCADKAET